jgi:hypothetical protein
LIIALADSEVARHHNAFSGEVEMRLFGPRDRRTLG